MSAWRPVNIETGEVGGADYYVRHRNQDAAYHQIQTQKGRSEAFFFNGTDQMREAASVLTLAQSGYLLLLASYIDYNGVIRDGKEPADTAVMMRLLRLETKRSTFYDFLAVCLDNGYIAEQDGEYRVDKALHFRGKAGKVPLVRAFIVRLRALYDEVGAHDLGLLYRIIPLIHRDTNVICGNPEEGTPSKIRKLNRKQLAEVTGVDPATISRVAGRAIFRGKSVFAKITTATDGTFYMVNPQIFRRKDVEYSAEVRGVFGIDD